MKNWPDIPMTCEQAELTMALYIANEPDMPEKRRLAFEQHLKNCPKCLKEYKESKCVIELIRQHWEVSEDTLDLIEKASRNYKPKMTIEEGWKDLCRRCPDLAESTKPPKICQLFLRISAVAACLVIGVLTWMVFQDYSKPKAFPQASSWEHVVSILKPSVKIELIDGTSTFSVPAGTKITTGKNELKTLVINSNRRMRLNQNTNLTIEPSTHNGMIGCVVKLDIGEIYTHVEHDGKPFIVQTQHGNAVITGTTFDIKTDDNNTSLVVAEGTVRFESDKGKVNVGAGQLSKIANQMAPLKPLMCNASNLTMWATDSAIGPTLAQAGSNSDSFELPWPNDRSPIVLEQTDYKQWVEQKRDWFKQQFPWIFELKEALAKESIQIDYPELLIQTGNVWQFVWPETMPARFSKPDWDSLLRVAIKYGFDKQWLLESVPATKYALEKPASSEGYLTGLKAFEQWAKILEEAKIAQLPTTLYSYHGSAYLAETRSLIWFAVQRRKYGLDRNRAQVLDLLQKEIEAASKYQTDVLYADERQKLLCDEDAVMGKTSEKKIEYIREIKGIEEKIERLMSTDKRNGKEFIKQ